jgi:hypothetical protein
VCSPAHERPRCNHLQNYGGALPTPSTSPSVTEVALRPTAGFDKVFVVEHHHGLRGVP